MNSANLSIPDMKRRLAALLLEKSYREGHFVLASGRESDFYFDGRQTALHPEGAWLIGNLFYDLLSDLPALDAVGGMTLARIRWLPQPRSSHGPENVPWPHSLCVKAPRDMARTSISKGWPI